MAGIRGVNYRIDPKAGAVFAMPQDGPRTTEPEPKALKNSDYSTTPDYSTMKLLRKEGRYVYQPYFDLTPAIAAKYPRDVMVRMCG